jgi:small subunit ribosomal protein S9
MAENYYATGRRKDAVARVWLTEGTGEIVVNDRPLAQYVTRASLEAIVQAPFAVTDTLGRFSVRATAKGGGITGQAGAVRHGIARALVAYDETYRTVLRRLGLLTRDARVKERKKYGRKRARRGFQFSKR